jgi:hypothetical protein
LAIIQSVPTKSNFRTLAVAAAVCGISRFLAMARTMWDWDEALFCLAMRSYDVAAHQPHPPGYPTFIALAKVVRLFIHDDFRALQSLNLIAGALLFPAMYLLGRAIGLRFGTAVLAGLLCAFFPNVWLFGGTAFSDITSLTLVTFAVALLFRSSGVSPAGPPPSPAAYWVGTVLLAVAIGMRPQNLLIGAFPGIRASTRRRPWEVAVAAAIGIVITAVSFGGAALATGPERYFAAVREHAAYISKTDSFRSPDRPSLLTMFDRFFLSQHNAAVLSYIVSLFVLIALIAAIRERSRPVARIVLTFGPFAVLAWLMLDRFSTSRFSMGYVPMFAILAAYGFEKTRLRIAGFALVAAFVVWLWPALSVVRNAASPPVAAVEAARDVRPLYVGTAMVPFVRYLAPELDYVQVIDERAQPLSGARDAWLLTELDRTEPAGRVFHRDTARLWNIVRHRYFDTALQHLDRPAEFQAGWEPARRTDHEEWRCTTGVATTLLPASGGRMRLRLMLTSPQPVEVTLNGTVLDRFVAPDIVDRQYDVTPANGTNELVLSSSARVCVRNLSWGKV